MNFSALALLMLFVFASCGKTNSYSKKQKSLNPTEMNALIVQQKFFCSDSDFCPEGVARMFAINFGDHSLSSSCSAFLVADDLVMTNSHCIWTGDLTLEETCQGLYFAFPSPHAQTQTAQCSKIIWRDQRQNGRSSYRRGDNDFALVKLDHKVTIRPLKLSSKISKGQMVHPLVMDQFDAITARITKLDCEVAEINRYGVAILKNCPIISGNSGSAVLDENQKVVAVVFASSNTHVRNPTDDLELRTQGNSTQGKTHTIAHIKTIMGELLSSALQE